MTASVDEITAVLRLTPSLLDTLLIPLPEDWTHRKLREDAWSPFEVVGHLIEGEKTDWLPRIELILAHDDEPTFLPFDRTSHLGTYDGVGLQDLLRKFREIRMDNLHRLSGLGISSSDLGRTGMHPTLGSTTVANLLSAWAVHDIDHLDQILRTIVHDVGAQAGAFAKYMRLLRDS